MSKPIGRKNYGSIGHLPGSRLGPGDHTIHEGQARILTEKTRDKHDLVIVQEKVDGSNVGVARVSGNIVPLTRAGYHAGTSPYAQHHHFAAWVMQHYARFYYLLREGERLCGEWMVQAHGIRYDLPHEPFIAFDLMRGDERASYAELRERTEDRFVCAHLIHIGGAMDVATCLARADERNAHGALEPIEGVVYRLERQGKVEFLAKHVRHSHVAGKYLNGPEVANTWVDDAID